MIWRLQIPAPILGFLWVAVIVGLSVADSWCSEGGPAHHVIDDEFPPMHRGEKVVERSDELNAVWDSYLQVQPAYVNVLEAWE